jgi:hypothetical protein
MGMSALPLFSTAAITFLAVAFLALPLLASAAPSPANPAVDAPDVPPAITPQTVHGTGTDALPATSPVTLLRARRQVSSDSESDESEGKCEGESEEEGKSEGEDEGEDEGEGEDEDEYEDEDEDEDEYEGEGEDEDGGEGEGEGEDAVENDYSLTYAVSKLLEAVTEQCDSLCMVSIRFILYIILTNDASFV